MLDSKIEIMDSKKAGLVLTGEALAILNANATERKRGEFVSRLLMDWAASRSPDKEPGVLEAIAASVRRIEKKLAD